MEYIRHKIDQVHQEKVHPYLTAGEAQADREIAHERALGLAERVQGHEIAVRIMGSLFTYKSDNLATIVSGISMRNPLGLAAGFDKNARIHRLLGQGLGFGAVKVGSITKEPYKGNDRPRIFDLPNNDGLINRMGFPGDGSDEAQARLEADKSRRNYSLVVNIAASRPSFDRNTQIEDYVEVAKQLRGYGDGHEINVSSPNTPGVRGLQEPEVFSDLAQALKPAYRVNFLNSYLNSPPYMYKFGPDLPMDQLLKNIQTAKDNGARGVSLGNTVTGDDVRHRLSYDVYKDEAGGISGQPLKEKALERSHQVYLKMGEEIDITLIGGIQNAEDVWRALTYGGAKAVDVYSAFVRPTTSTPNFTYYILRDLHRAMKAEGIGNMSQFKDLRGKAVPFPKI